MAVKATHNSSSHLCTVRRDKPNLGSRSQNWTNRYSWLTRPLISWPTMEFPTDFLRGQQEAVWSPRVSWRFRRGKSRGLIIQYCTRLANRAQIQLISTAPQTQHGRRLGSGTCLTLLFPLPVLIWVISMWQLRLISPSPLSLSPSSRKRSFVLSAAVHCWRVSRTVWTSDELFVWSARQDLIHVHTHNDAQTHTLARTVRKA